MAFGEWRKILAKFSSFKVGETERQIFCRALCARDFLLCAQSLVKSTQGETKIFAGLTTAQKNTIVFEVIVNNVVDNSADSNTKEYFFQ